MESLKISWWIIVIYRNIFKGVTFHNQAFDAKVWIRQLIQKVTKTAGLLYRFIKAEL